MEQKLKVDINIEDKPITYFSTLVLNQRFNEHHNFELRFNHDMVEQYSVITVENSKNFLGKTITIQFGTNSNDENRFIGFVTKVELVQSEGFNGDIIVSGHSQDIVLERGPGLGSYLDKNLETILKNVSGKTIQNDLNFKIQPVRKSPIDYLIQYKESDFEFINRLSAQYFEWFYYDGTNLNFGKPDKLDELDLIYGRDLRSLQYEIQLGPLKHKSFSYNAQNNEVLTSAGADASGSGISDLQHAVNVSNNLFSKTYNELMQVRAGNTRDIGDSAEMKQKALVSQLVKIIGKSDNPAVSLAKVVNIMISKRGPGGFEVNDFGKFLITSVCHTIDGVGHYSNHFEGLTADTQYLPSKANQPQPEMQMAEVMSNNDPAKQGRIKVKFKWESDANDETEWLRVVTPNAGSDGQGQNNRGFMAIPEAGDQVLVGFEEGNLARPVIMGSLYHSGNGDSQQQVNNNIKSIITRSGCTIQFDDTQNLGSITISDPSGNTWFMDGKGNITVTAPGNFTVNAGANITLNAGVNAAVNAGANVLETAGMNIAHSAGAMIRQNAVEDYSLIAANIIKMAKANITTVAKTGNKQAEQDITVTSQQGNINHHAQKEIQNNSSENAKMH